MRKEQCFDYKKIINNALKENTDIHPISQEELLCLQNCLYGMAIELDEGCATM